jgi:hypothetical protein
MAEAKSVAIEAEITRDRLAGVHRQPTLVVCRGWHPYSNAAISTEFRVVRDTMRREARLIRKWRTDQEG